MRNLSFLYSFILLVFCSQNINAQFAISSPTLVIPKACAGAGFNTYDATITFSPSSDLQSNNQFIIELSDETGNFANPTIIYTSAPGSITVSPATLTFSFPTDVAGEAYRIRVKSTAPAATSSRSNSFPAYYKIHDTPFSINNLISSASFCSGGSYLLTIDNPGAPSNDSPLQYESLTFNWFKEDVNNPTVSVFIQTSETLTVTEEGRYFVETNYGSCTSNSYSNRVYISESGSGGASEISSSLGNPFCPAGGVKTILSAISGGSYQWFKNGVLLQGENSQTYATNKSGVYSVNINLGSCFTSSSISLLSNGFTSSIDVDPVNNLDEDESIIATISTDAVTPQFQWFFNDILMPSETGNSYEVTEIGEYKAIVTQTTGCQDSSEFIFIAREAFPDVPLIPNLISPNNDFVNDTWVIPREYTEGTNTEVIILSSQGETVLRTNDYQNNWPDSDLNITDVNLVFYYIITTENNQTKKGSITVVR